MAEWMREEERQRYDAELARMETINQLARVAFDLAAKLYNNARQEEIMGIAGKLMSISYDEVGRIRRERYKR